MILKSAVAAIAALRRVAAREAVKAASEAARLAAMSEAVTLGGVGL